MLAGMARGQRAKTTMLLFGRAQQGGIALIVALASPLLIAMTALTVDAGYWYEQQESLQSAADAAALAAASAYIQYSTADSSLTPIVFASGAGKAFAVAAANYATNNQFNLTSSSSTQSNYTVLLTPNSSGTTWTATAKIQRSSFFSGVRGLGLPGEPSGTQSTSSTATILRVTSGACMIAHGAITQHGNGAIKGTNCGIFDEDIAANSLSVPGSGSISGTTVSTAASSYSSQGSNGSIGAIDSNGNIQNGDVQTSAPVPENAFQNLDNLASPNDIWAPFSPPSSATTISPISGSNNGGIFNEPTGSYYISTSQEYDITITSGINSINGTIYYLNGGIYLADSWGNNNRFYTNFTSGFYDINGATSGFLSSTCNEYSCSPNSAGIDMTQGATYFGANSSGQCDGSQSVWFITGGIQVTNGSSGVTFCPGTYYIKGGGLLLQSGAKVTAKNVTFILEDGAGFYDYGAASFNISAPSGGSCVSPTDYPEAQFVSGFPYDGTNGYGICGVAIYQIPDDTAEDVVAGSGSVDITGSIVAPDTSEFYISGAGTMNITSTGGPALDVGSVWDDGSGVLSMTENSSESSSNNISSSTALLTN